MAGQQYSQPMYINPNKQRSSGRDALSMNINAAKAVANVVRSTLGPKGMDKMLVNSVGDIILTNDGATILDEMDIEHPTAKMIVEVSSTQDNVAGDGTTSAVVITGELMDKAEEMVHKGVHPTIIAKGYKMAAYKAQEILENYAITTTKGDREVLEKIAKTSITGKASESYGDYLPKICVDAVTAIEDNGEVNVEGNILITQEVGGKASDTELISGIMLNKGRLHSNMPKKIQNAKIALVNAPIEVEKTHIDSKVQISSPDEMSACTDREESQLKEMAESVISSGADAIFCSKGLDDRAVHYLQKNGIFAARRVGSSEMKSLSHATGARLVQDVNELEETDLGTAGLVEQEGEFDNTKTYIKGCPNKIVTIIIHGGTEHVTDNIERAIDDALKVIKAVVEDGKIVPGGGASEIEVALGLRDYAVSIGGRQQLAISAFADAVESIPKSLATNAGFDSIDSLLELRTKHSSIENAGINLNTGETIDMYKSNIVDPLRVKTQAIKSASEAAVMVLRIDDVLRSQKQSMPDVKPEHNVNTYEGMTPPQMPGRR
ncbi:MAG: thermosome subunit alpha [Methanohalobium sp.]|uniref:thermosome subunit alpha n=1 Tax=Methanohalobium sp. TaxID=2837493 RepID=UPI00397A2989